MKKNVTTSVKLFVACLGKVYSLSFFMFLYFLQIQIQQYIFKEDRFYHPHVVVTASPWLVTIEMLFKRNISLEKLNQENKNHTSL